MKGIHIVRIYAGNIDIMSKGIGRVATQISRNTCGNRHLERVATIRKLPPSRDPDDTQMTPCPLLVNRLSERMKGDIWVATGWHLGPDSKEVATHQECLYTKGLSTIWVATRQRQDEKYSRGGVYYGHDASMLRIRCLDVTDTMDVTLSVLVME